MAKRTLTNPFIKNFSNPEKRTEIYDEHVPGLALRVTPTGYKSFVYRYRFNEKVRRFTIGSYPKISLAKARDEAKELSYKVSSGVDPLEEKKNRKQQPEAFTFSQLCKRYEKRHLPTLRQRTQDEYKRIIKKELKPKLGRYPANNISRKQIVDLLDAIAIDRGKAVLSNRVRAVLSSIFSFGIDKAILEFNPVLNVKRKKKEKKRERIYNPDEVKALWDAFEQQDEPVQSLYKMLMICGQRSGETRRMKWEDINANKAVWIIPAQQTKANRTHVVPLPELALHIIEHLKPLTGKSDYVFQSPVGNQPIEWLQKASERIQTASKVSDFRIHDLRRTAASYMAKIGTNRTVLGKILNHKGLAGDDQVTAIYDRHSYMDEKRQALNRWSQHLQKILSGEEKQANIHKIA